MVYFMFKIYDRNYQMEIIFIKRTYGSFRLPQSQLGSKDLIQFNHFILGSERRVVSHACAYHTRSCSICQNGMMVGVRWSTSTFVFVCSVIFYLTLTELKWFWLLTGTQWLKIQAFIRKLQIMTFLCLQTQTGWRSCLLRDALAECGLSPSWTLPTKVTYSSVCMSVMGTLDFLMPPLHTLLLGFSRVGSWGWIMNL